MVPGKVKRAHVPFGTARTAPPSAPMAMQPAHRVRNPWRAQSIELERRAVDGRVRVESMGGSPGRIAHHSPPSGLCVLSTAEPAFIGLCQAGYKKKVTNIIPEVGR